MKIFKIIGLSILTTGVSLLLSVMNFSCIMPADSPGPRFQMKLSSVRDTVSPYAPILICFNEQLKDSSVQFRFEPPFYSYYVQLNSSGDTATINLTEPLEGQSHYSIRLDESINSVSGSAIDMSTDSVLIFTYAHEQEPNNDPATADQLETRMFGSVSFIDDSDFYSIPDNIKSIYLKSVNMVSFRIIDCKGKLSSERQSSEFDSLILPSDFVKPLFFKIFSSHKSAGEYYETGFTLKK